MYFERQKSSSSPPAAGVMPQTPIQYDNNPPSTCEVNLHTFVILGRFNVIQGSKIIWLASGSRGPAHRPLSH